MDRPVLKPKFLGRTFILPRNQLTQKTNSTYVVNIFSTLDFAEDLGLPVKRRKE